MRHLLGLVGLAGAAGLGAAALAGCYCSHEVGSATDGAAPGDAALARADAAPDAPDAGDAGPALCPDDVISERRRLDALAAGLGLDRAITTASGVVRAVDAGALAIEIEGEIVTFRWVDADGLAGIPSGTPVEVSTHAPGWTVVATTGGATDTVLFLGVLRAGVLEGPLPLPPLARGGPLSLSLVPGCRAETGSCAGRLFDLDADWGFGGGARLGARSEIWATAEWPTVRFEGGVGGDGVAPACEADDVAIVALVYQWFCIC